MYEVHVTLEGLADFLYNRMTPEDLEAFRGGQTGGTLTDAQRKEAAEKRLYVDKEGCYLPEWTTKRVLLEGARWGKLKLGKKPLDRILAAVAFVQEPSRFMRGGKPIKLRDYLREDIGRTPPKKGVCTIVRRPALKAGWQLMIRLMVLDDVIPDKAIKEAFEMAGMYVGVGAWRPEFGRFIVRSFTTKRGTGKE